jgi:hypothetical protein
VRVVNLAIVAYLGTCPQVYVCVWWRVNSGLMRGGVRLDPQRNTNKYNCLAFIEVAAEQCGGGKPEGPHVPAPGQMQHV